MFQLNLNASGDSLLPSGIASLRGSKQTIEIQQHTDFLQISENFHQISTVTEPATRGFTQILLAISEEFTCDLCIFLKIYGRFTTNF